MRSRKTPKLKLKISKKTGDILFDVFTLGMWTLAFFITFTPGRILSVADVLLLYGAIFTPNIFVTVTSAMGKKYNALPFREKVLYWELAFAITLAFAIPFMLTTSVSVLKAYMVFYLPTVAVVFPAIEYLRLRKKKLV